MSANLIIRRVTGGPIVNTADELKNRAVLIAHEVDPEEDMPAWRMALLFPHLPIIEAIRTFRMIERAERLSIRLLDDGEDFALALDDAPMALLAGEPDIAGLINDPDFEQYNDADRSGESRYFGIRWDLVAQEMAERWSVRSRALIVESLTANSVARDTFDASHVA